jgi:hypothetical protein
MPRAWLLSSCRLLPNNRKQHETLQQFMPVHDSVTVALLVVRRPESFWFTLFRNTTDLNCRHLEFNSHRTQYQPNLPAPDPESSFSSRARTITVARRLWIPPNSSFPRRMPKLA